MKPFLLAAALASTVLGGAALAGQATNAPAPMPGHQGHHGGGFKKADANGDGIVTRDEFVAQAAAKFAKVDANNDGKVTPEEMQAVRGKMRERFAGMRHGARGPVAEGAVPGESPMPPRGMRGPGRFGGDPDGGRGPGGMMLQRLDTNADGKISRAEFGVPSDRQFERLDANKDGQIDATEMKAAQDVMRQRMERMRAMHGGPGGDISAAPAPQQDTGK